MQPTVGRRTVSLYCMKTRPLHSTPLLPAVADLILVRPAPRTGWTETMKVTATVFNEGKANRVVVCTEGIAR